MNATLHTDGGSRGNPGPAGIGAVLALDDQTFTHQAYIGETTNNQAEYKALLAGLKMAREHKVQELHCYLDSELVVKQLNKQYKVKQPGMKLLFAEVQIIVAEFKKLSFNHVPRAENKHADKLVNEALDENESPANV